MEDSMSYQQPTKPRYHKIDGWRGYPIPQFAIAGASDTGGYRDSPAPTDEVADEIRRFQRECLRPVGIRSRSRYGQSTNVFMMKRWIVVSPADWRRAAKLADEWLQANRLRYLHDADQDQLKIKEET
jgi:hypothetical protein